MKASWSQLALATAVSTALTGCGGGTSPNNDIDFTSSAANKPTPTYNYVAIAPDYSAIEDDSLRNCIRNTGITDIAQLQMLECPDYGIESLEGIEQFSELTVLNIRSNALQSASELVSLKKLTWLDISSNLLSNDRELRELSQLQFLNIEFNQFSVLDLSNLSKLTKLYAANNRLNTLTIAGLNSLQHINAENNDLPEDQKILPASIKTFRI